MTACVSQPEVRPVFQDWYLSGRVADELESQFIPLSPFPFRVGRKAGLSLTLPRQTVSSLHAEFFRLDQRLMIRDLNSTNGTFVNGQRLIGDAELRPDDVVQFADAPFRVTPNQPEVPSHTRCKDACDQALAIVQFDRLLSGKSLVPNFQPIVELATQNVIAYEALARSRVVGLETPDFMFSTAAQLGSTAQLSRIMRQVSVESSSVFPQSPHLFLNTHPSELSTEALLESCIELRKLAPQQKITIEMHEAAMTHVSEMLSLCRGLEAIDMTLAFDDFGAGQARIAELAEVRPRYIKFDRCMIRDLDTAENSRRRVVQSLVAMARDLGIVPLAEGVETAGEHAASLDLGFILAQGYYYGKPMPALHYRKPGAP